MQDDKEYIPFSSGENIGQEEDSALFETRQNEFSTAILLAVDAGKYDAQQSMEELAALCEAYGLETLAEVMQKRDRPDSATQLGIGRLAEAKELAENLGADVAVFDGELTGSQLHKMEEHLGIPVIDRTMLILEIFAQRALTKEGKTQTELAMLEYRLPRLAGHGTSLSRQGGGGGGGAGARRGGGESKLEYDRRYIRSRIAILKKRLKEMETRRGETRRTRNKSGVPLVAMVGYTNVGKSSLVNALCGSDILVADMLFATLDPTSRKMVLPDGQTVVLVDTVGFVSRLPHNLVEAFKSTLEEAKYADVLLLVVDAADEDAPEQLDVTQDVLKSLGIDSDVPRLVVYNKSDKLVAEHDFSDDAMLVSANTGRGLDALKARLVSILSQRMCFLHVVLPYDKLSLAENFRQHGRVEKEEYREDGVYYAAGIEKSKAHIFEKYLVNSAE